MSDERDVQQLNRTEYRSAVVQLENGSWVLGTLEAFRPTQGSWMGFVRYKLLDGKKRVQWMTADRIRL